MYDPEAIATEQAAITVGDEFRRRVRIGAGNFHALRYTWRLLSPTAGLVSLAYWSHKVLRWLVPLALALALCSAMSLAGERFYAFATIAAVIVCAMALVGYYLERGAIRTRLFGIPYYFLSMNLALALGLLRCLSGKQLLVWNRTAARNPLERANERARRIAIRLAPAAMPTCGCQDICTVVCCARATGPVSDLGHFRRSF